MSTQVAFLGDIAVREHGMTKLVVPFPPDDSGRHRRGRRVINRLIELSLKHRFIVLASYVGLAGWGCGPVGATAIDAIPDLSHNQVIVFKDWPGHSPQELEDQVNYPLTVSLSVLQAFASPARSRRFASR